MISNTWKLATVLGVAGAIALSVASAEARNVRNPVRGAVASDYYAPRGSYNYEAGPRSGGVYFGGAQNGSSNYNPNAN